MSPDGYHCSGVPRQSASVSSAPSSAARSPLLACPAASAPACCTFLRLSPCWSSQRPSSCGTFRRWWSKHCRTKRCNATLSGMRCSTSCSALPTYATISRRSKPQVPRLNPPLSCSLPVRLLPGRKGAKFVAPRKLTPAPPPRRAALGCPASSTLPFARRIARTARVVVVQLPGAGSLDAVPFTLARADRVVAAVLARASARPGGDKSREPSPRGRGPTVIAAYGRARFVDAPPPAPASLRRSAAHSH